MKDKIYIAGALNSDACGYIQNLHNMIESANTIRKMGASVFIPGLDFLLGLVDGEMGYFEYIDNDDPWVVSCDALYVVPGSEKSVGVAREIKMAEDKGIPVFFKHWEVFEFINRSKIMCLIGESGSGKSLISEYIKGEYDIPLIQSYTTRKKRNRNDDDHTFISNEAFDEIQLNEMVAYTKWGDVRYCCKHEDIEKRNVYVIDESGYSMLKSKYSRDYKICGVRIHRDEEKRRVAVGDKRVDRDAGKFIYYDGDFDYNVHNDKPKYLLFKEIDKIVLEFFYN